MRHCGYGEVLPQCEGCMKLKTLFKATMKSKRRLECHVEQSLAYAGFSKGGGPEI